jgi:hypothetical protein
MHRTLTLVACVIATLGLTATTAAAAAPNICGPAYKDRMLVIKKHGKRAPGRNICRFGVKLSNGKVVDATVKQKKRYRAQLKQLVRPAPALLAVQAVPPSQAPAGTASASVRAPVGGTLAAIRACETRGQPNPYTTNTGNGFYGSYQFDLPTWQSVGGTGLPSNASPAEQDKRAAILYSQRGSSPWPVCG